MAVLPIRQAVLATRQAGTSVGQSALGETELIDTPDIGINTQGVRKTGGYVGTLADAASKHLAHALDAASKHLAHAPDAGYAVGDDQWGRQSGTSLNACARAWEDHMVDLANRLAQGAQDVANAANAYDVVDVAAERRMRLALGDLGKG
ncbi:hypothetical protein [Streptantibioticus ferralitis]|uniref:Excreted virulence factor EspC, type VII ESX diderm n=1 Tax=Streptantibioticus ferralitis TaxID=236510 RepID=A0ABT5Z960_9ACTN|nr:hypothetical protein [Streptantibioticus ferralitis]MDF2260352.1 hypothetical protein [Streptantibioticus ferralitis]